MNKNITARCVLLAASLGLAVAALATAPSANAALILFTANLTGLQEVPANASPASGNGTALLDNVANTITVNESWSGLVGPATASHIHTGAVGVNGAVTFAFASVPAATSGSIPQQVFAMTAAQITALTTGGMYMNIHDAVFPGGEIRGQLLAVPEPSTAALLVAAALGMAARRRRRAHVAA